MSKKIIESLNFPRYNGNETQFEHIFYTYFDRMITTKGYISKIKKTGYSNIDDNIISMQGLGKGSCDSYILSSNESNALFALLELESTRKVKTGITQVRKYAEGLHDAYKAKNFFTKHEKILLIVYDGQLLWVSEYNLKTGNEKELICDGSNGVEVHQKEKTKLFKLFPMKEIVNTQEDEKSLIKTIKNLLRANKTLQGNKAFILTVLASIYGNSKKDKFQSAIEYLKSQSSSDNETSEIYEKWEKIKIKIEYDSSSEIRSKIIELYEQVSIKLYTLAQDKKLDLYGYIYEELAEKATKKEEGEYYTPRTHIRPIVNSIFEKYLKNIWGLTKNKKQNIEILSKKNVIDPFCGSAGFLYEYLKVLKRNYDISNNEINDIAYKSIHGFDKNDITSAYFNLFLIGDGRSNLTQVTTSINWENYWKYELKDNTKTSSKTKIKILENKSMLESSIDKNIDTFVSFLNNLIDMNFIKNNFSINSIYENSLNAEEFIKIYINKNNIRRDEFFYRLIHSSYKESKNPLLLLFYNTLVEVSDNSEPIEFKLFLQSIGNIDFLMTNVPYGDIDDPRIKGDYSQKLESQALKECIDLLRPSSTKRDNTTGKLNSNDDGGIATIVIPNGLLERDEFELKEYLLQRCDILSIIQLPFYTFSPYAQIQTYFITVRKKAVFEFNTYTQKHDVFMYIIDNDGKANSDKRFETKLISRDRNDIYKNGKKVNSVYEYIHDELSINLEEYPEGYFSKLERCWIYGNYDEFDKKWNQDRITEKWNGENWGKTKGEKWNYAPLIKKVYKKQIEKTNKKVITAIRKILLDNDEFISLDIDTQKEYIINYHKKDYLKNIHSIELNKDKTSTVLYKENKKPIQNQGLKLFIFERYKSEILDNTINVQELHQECLINYDSAYNSIVSSIKEFLNDINSILIFNEGEEIKLLSDILYNLYDLKINNYLSESKILDADKVEKELIRLLTIQENTNYDNNLLREYVNDAVNEINQDENKPKHIPLYELMEGYQERGNRITLEDIYNDYGEYPVYSATITGNIGFYNQSNYTLRDNSFLYAIEGNAGSITIAPSSHQKIWIFDVAGVFNIKEEYIERFSKEAIAIYLEFLFRNNRHNNSSQPKFLIKKNLDLEIDLNIIEIFTKYIKF